MRTLFNLEINGLESTLDKSFDSFSGVLQRAFVHSISSKLLRSPPLLQQDVKWIIQQHLSRDHRGSNGRLTQNWNHHLVCVHHNAHKRICLFGQRKKSHRNPHFPRSVEQGLLDQPNERENRIRNHFVVLLFKNLGDTVRDVTNEGKFGPFYAIIRKCDYGQIEYIFGNILRNNQSCECST